MFKKINLPILLTVMCGLLLVVVLLYGFNTGRFGFWGNNTKKQTGLQTKEEVKITRTDYTQVARKTLDWIDKQRNKGEGRVLGKMCSKDGCETKNKDDLIATWARLNFYEQHKDPKDLEIVKKDIDKFWDKYKDDDLSDSLWLCKITYEMAQSKNLDQNQKDKLKKICFDTKEITVDEMGRYWKEHFEKETKTPFPQITSNNNAFYIRYFDNFFGRITDLVYKYVWSSDKKYKDLIEKYFLMEEDLVLSDKTIQSQDICLFGLSVLDEWKLINKSRARLDYVVNLYKKIEIKNENDDLLTNPICGLLVKDLFEATKEMSFLEKLELNNKKIIANNQREEIGEIGDGSVRSDLSKEGSSPDRNVAENALIVELLRK